MSSRVLKEKERKVNLNKKSRCLYILDADWVRDSDEESEETEESYDSDFIYYSQLDQDEVNRARISLMADRRRVSPPYQQICHVFAL